MATIKKLVFKVLLSLFLVGCATSSQQFFDSAMNDRNRAPASLGIPAAFDQEITTVDSMHNQAEADYLFLRSELESANGSTSESIELLRNALIYDPGSSTLMQKLAIEYYKNSKVNDALDWARKARQISPERRDVALLVAGLCTTTKEFAEAEVIYKELIKKNSQDSEATLYLGAVYTEQRSFAKAIQSFKKLTLMPASSSKHLAHYYLARVYSEQSKKNSAQVKSELKKSISVKPDFFEAVSMLGQILEKESGTVAAYKFYEEQQRQNGPNVKLAEMLSQYYILQNKFDQAYEQLEIINESSDDLVQVKLKMALILIDKKLFDEAIAKLEEIIRIAPESDKVRFYLAAVNEEKKDFKTAFSHYMQIDQASSYFEDARLHAAYLSKLLGNLDTSIAVLKESVDKKVENPNSYFLLSQLQEDKKELNQALATLMLAQQKFPKNSQVFYYMGTLQDKMNLKTQMIESMQKVIQLEPEHAQALNFLAYNWAEKGEKLEQAESYARKAVLKEKEDAFILDTLGWVLFKKGDYKEAVAVLEKAHSMQPEVSIILEHLGDVYTKMDRHEKARVLFIKAVENEENSDRKKEIKGKLSLIEDKIKSARMPTSAAGVADTNVSP